MLYYDAALGNRSFQGTTKLVAVADVALDADAVVRGFNGDLKLSVQQYNTIQIKSYSALCPRLRL